MRNSKRDLIPNTYEAAAAMLRTSRLGGQLTVCNNTRLVRHPLRPYAPCFQALENAGAEDIIGLELHDTVVFAWASDGRVCANHGGWQTVTTKDRINRAFSPGRRVYQHRGEWFLTGFGPDRPFKCCEVLGG